MVSGGRVHKVFGKADSDHLGIWRVSGIGVIESRHATSLEETSLVPPMPLKRITEDAFERHADAFSLLPTDDLQRKQLEPSVDDVLSLLPDGDPRRQPPGEDIFDFNRSRTTE